MIEIFQKTEYSRMVRSDRGNKEGLDPFINFISIDYNVEKKLED